MKKLVLALVAAVFLFPVVAFATSYWSGPKWVANTENWHLLSYFGEAYTVKGYGCLWQDKPTYNCSAKVHNSASSLGQKKKPLRAS